MIIDNQFNPHDPCPHPQRWEIDGHHLGPKQVIEQLSSFFHPERIKKIERALAQRTYQITPVLENIYDQGNINAVIRTSESFGLQSYHVVRSLKTKAQNRISRGAEKWTDGFQWDNGVQCLEKLKQAGYFIATTHLAANAVPIYELDACRPLALVIGNEHEGISSRALEMADANIIIPSVGFTQSFNLSVAAALCLHELYRMRVKKLGRSGDLSSEHHQRLKASFLFHSLKSAPEILTRFSRGAI